ncbi:metal ABC transporter ATP-binding protein [Vagococcus silagei]|uniref:Metal ABC transporter ATP-binding protein n=1 Tax=Vagococcus silagei TaxID=2508885 RepID=A0A4S3B7B0_9ENTE|nr:metal ABC transporter ATP-binding protein [Vagococcus silagei]THB62347.1 metal ABC transporter ATP-binding protein [Vagococcus silagei]
MNHTIEIEQLSVAYQDKIALQNISLNLTSGSITGIIGPNGAGKSTLIKSIVGLIKKESGVVKVDGKPLDDFRKRIAYVEQRSAIDLTFPIRVSEVVLLGTYPKLGLFKRPGKKEKQKVQECLAKVQMTEFADRQIGNLSGGQLQRVFIARALAQDAEIIFLDEPFVGIDMVSEKLIVDLLKELKEAGKMIVIVHHDLHRTREYFDDLVILNKHLVAAGPVEDVFRTKYIQEAYGESMGEIVIKGVSD